MLSQQDIQQTDAIPTTSMYSLNILSTMCLSIKETDSKHSITSIQLHCNNEIKSDETENNQKQTNTNKQTNTKTDRQIDR